MLFPQASVLRFYFPLDKLWEADRSVLRSSFHVKFSVLMKLFVISTLIANSMVWLSRSCKVVWFIPTLGSFCASQFMLTRSEITRRVAVVSLLSLKWNGDRNVSFERKSRLALIYLTCVFRVILESPYIKGRNVTEFSKTMNNGPETFLYPVQVKEKKVRFQRLVILYIFRVI